MVMLTRLDQKLCERDGQTTQLLETCCAQGSVRRETWVHGAPSVVETPKFHPVNMRGIGDMLGYHNDLQGRKHAQHFGYRRRVGNNLPQESLYLLWRR